MIHLQPQSGSAVYLKFRLQLLLPYKRKIDRSDFIFELEELLSIDNISVIEEEESLIIETPLYKVLIGKLKTEIKF